MAVLKYCLTVGEILNRMLKDSFPELSLLGVRGFDYFMRIVSRAKNKN